MPGALGALELTQSVSPTLGELGYKRDVYQDRCVVYQTCQVDAAGANPALGDGAPALKPARGETSEEGARGAISEELSARQCQPQRADMSAALPNRIGGGIGKKN